MTRRDRRTLTGAASTFLTDIGEGLDGLTSDELAQLFEDRFSEVIDTYWQRIRREGVIRLLCRMIKSMAALDRSGHPLQLPLDLEEVRITQVIGLPGPLTEGDEEQKGRDGVRWYSVWKINRVQYARHLRMKLENSERDQRNIRDGLAVVDFLDRQFGDQRMDEPIGKLLQEAAQREALERARAA